MKKNFFILYYILLPVECILALLNAVILFMHSRIASFDLFITSMLILQILIAVIALVINLIFQKKAVPLYISLLVFCWAVMSAVVYLSSFGIAEFWPCFVVLAGILLIISGLYKYKKLKFGFVIPSFTLIGMGGWYLLFSFKIIKFSFLTIAAILGPVFMLAIAVFLILFFLAQQRHKELVIKDENTGTFEDEDVPLDRLDD
ncbi:MAG: hypothetical protein J6J00_01620 [Treponema sp.]|nr:hypothetical protein [Treponema sp.]